MGGVIRVSSNSHAMPGEMIRIFVVYLTTEQQKYEYDLEVSNGWWVRDLKERLVNLGIPALPKDQVLIFKNTFLHDYHTLYYYNIHDKSTLCLANGLPGGQRGNASAHRCSRFRERDRSRTPRLSPPRRRVPNPLAGSASEAVAEAPATAGGRRRDCVVMMSGMVIAGHALDVETLVKSIMDR